MTDHDRFLPHLIACSEHPGVTLQALPTGTPDQGHYQKVYECGSINSPASLALSTSTANWPIKQSGSNVAVITPSQVPLGNTMSLPILIHPQLTDSQHMKTCKACGEPGKFKDGRCREKWRPGAAGPATLCDK